MSNIPRKSLNPASQSNILRRSSSADVKLANSNSVINNFSQMSSSSSSNGRQSLIDGRQSIGSQLSRASSMGCSGRQSIAGRQSMAGKQSSESRSNPEMASIIYSVLQMLDVKTLYSIKDLCQPNSSTFYAVFEDLLNAIGILDVWNPKHLEPPHESKSKQALPNQQAQPNAASQNKAKLELIIFHLNMLRYQYIPKLNILQSMSTPKNWTCMLQILCFLALSWRFFENCNIPRYLSTVTDRENTFKYLKETFRKSLEDSRYLGSETHQKLQKEFLIKYEISLRGAYNKKQLIQDRDSHRKQFECLESTKNELEDLEQEVQEMLCKLAVDEKSINDANILFDDKYKNLKSEKKEVQSLQEKLELSDKELALKDAEYDKQLALQTNGNQIDNLPVKHTQKVQELDSLQNTFIEIENKIDEVQSKQIQKITEIKVSISSANDLVNKIILSSALEVEKLPHLDVLDFHKKRDLLKDYKDKIQKIREKYVVDICKLPEQFSQVKTEKKMVESKLEQSKTTKAQHVEDIKRFEIHIAKLQKESEEALGLINLELDKLNKQLLDKERLQKIANDDLSKEKVESEKIFNEQKKVELELEVELRNAKENQAQKAKLYENEIRAKEKIASEYINQKSETIIQIKKMIADFMAKDVIEKASWDIENKRILEKIDFE